MISIRSAFIGGVILAIAVLAGCGRGKVETVAIEYEIEGGNAQTADEFVGVLAERAVLLSGRTNYRIHSRRGIMIVYLTGAPGESGAFLLRSLGEALDKVEPQMAVPAKRGKAWVLKTGEVIPTVEPKMEPSFEIMADLEKASAQGVTVRDIDQALAKLEKEVGPNPSLDRLKGITVENSVGTSVRLSEIASFKSTMVPDAVVRSWKTSAK